MAIRDSSVGEGFPGLKRSVRARWLGAETAELDRSHSIRPTVDAREVPQPVTATATTHLLRVSYIQGHDSTLDGKVNSSII